MFSSLVGAPSGPLRRSAGSSPALWVALDIPGLPDLAQVMYPGVPASSFLAVIRRPGTAGTHRSPVLPHAVTRQWLAESLPLILGGRRVLGRNRTGSVTSTSLAPVSFTSVGGA